MTEKVSVPEVSVTSVVASGAEVHIFRAICLLDGKTAPEVVGEAVRLYLEARKDQPYVAVVARQHQRLWERASNHPAALYAEAVVGDYPALRLVQ